MDTVTILRELWRVRLVVACVALFAVLAGVAVAYKISFPPKLESRRYDVGVAMARILVDTPSSQVVEVAPKGSDTLGVRANLLASLMVDGAIRSVIAHRAGLQPSQIVGTTDAAMDPTPAASAPQGHHAFVLTTQVLANSTGEQLPIIEIDAQAPDRVRAAKLASAAVSGLQDYLNSKAALQRVPDADRLQVTGLGAPQAATEMRGPSKVVAAIVTFLLFIVGCAGILGVIALIRGLQAASARDNALPEDDAYDDWEWEGEDVEEPEDDPYAVEVPGPEPAADADDDWLGGAGRPTLVPPTVEVPIPPETDEPSARSAWGR